MGDQRQNESKYTIPTRLIYGRHSTGGWDYSHQVIPPIGTSCTFRLESTDRAAEGFATMGRFPEPDRAPIYVYDRMGEPTARLLEQSLAIAEEGECGLVFSSGMAAINAAVCALVKQGDEIIAHRTLYGCTYSLFTEWLPRFGIQVHFHDFAASPDCSPVLSAHTRLIYIESPCNPTLEIIDFASVAKLAAQFNRNRASEARIYTAIDNTFATPFCQRPLRSGIDLVIHSLTKGLGGFGSDLGGAIVAGREFYERLFSIRKDFGAVMSAQTAWHILVYGLPTLELRTARQQENALNVATYLERHPKVARVLYPGLASFPQYPLARKLMRDYRGNFAPGTLLYLTLKGASPEDAGRKGKLMMDYIAANAYSLTLAVSLGQLRTLVTHPASTTHASYSAQQQLDAGIEPGGIRLALGIEDATDIINDLDAALAAAG